MHAALFLDDSVNSEHSSVGPSALLFLVNSRIFFCLRHIGIRFRWRLRSASASTETTEEVVSTSVSVAAISCSSRVVHIHRTNDRQLRDDLLC